MRRRYLLLFIPVLAGAGGTTLHIPIAPDPREDIALGVTVDGNIPAAMETHSGIVNAPDPRRAPDRKDPVYSAGVSDTDDATLPPDRNTKRPDVPGYDDPFVPSTAPFKRLTAFDAVNQNYELHLRDRKLVAFQTQREIQPGDDLFYGDLVVDLAPGRRVRIPSVGPGARVVKARLARGDQEIPHQFYRDGAENWFIEGSDAISGKARLVMQLAIARGAFGGDFSDSDWTQLPRTDPLPEKVLRAANLVTKELGLGRSQRPKEAIARLVAHFRSFVDSEEQPQGRGDIYLDLALSKKGVCRHRAFAFLVTARSLGVPTRAVMNEAHSWVEVHDGVMWRRIDLGGAGRVRDPNNLQVNERFRHTPPNDMYAWPTGSERGVDMIDDARRRRASEAVSPETSTASDGGTGGAPDGGGSGGSSGQQEDKPRPKITFSLSTPRVSRGSVVHVEGHAVAERTPCVGTSVEVMLRNPKEPLATIALGTLATDSQGKFSGDLMVLGVIPLGEYEVLALSRGGTNCGVGASE